MPKLVLRNVTVQSFFRIVSAATIKKIICGVEWDILIVIFNRLARIPKVALYTCAADGAKHGRMNNRWPHQKTKTLDDVIAMNAT